MQVHQYDRLRVEDGAEVLEVLRQSAASRAMCSVRAAGRAETYLSPLRELGDDGEPVLDPPRAPVIERALVPGSVASIDLRLSDCRVSFETRVARIGPVGGRPVLRLERPSAMVRLRKRETIRVQIPEGVAVRLTLDPSEPALTAVRMHDLCVQGGSVTLHGVRERFEHGRLFEHARLVMPDATEWPVSLRVVHTGVVRRVADRGEMRVGLQFVHPAERFEAAVGGLVGAIARGTTPGARR
jgi:hypothetical protein